MADPEELERTLGRNVRALRAARSLTQAELASRANVSLGALKHLEQGAGATVGTLVKVLRALDAEEWIDTLGPGRAPFNPLDLLAATKRESAKSTRAPRVRHPRRTTR